MKKRIVLSALVIIVIGVLIFLLIPKGNDNKITKEMAYNGVNNYCHKNYDWTIAEDNPSIMYVEMKEELDDEYQVVFRSYTGAFVYFYVNKETGMTKVIEKAPTLDIENNLGTINIHDYL